MPGGVGIYQPFLLTRGLRLIGHRADYMTYYIPESAAWLMQGPPDFNLNYNPIPPVFDALAANLNQRFIKNYRYDINSSKPMGVLSNYDSALTALNNDMNNKFYILNIDNYNVYK